jgi:S1-C subfamily serine protease
VILKVGGEGVNTAADVQEGVEKSSIGENLTVDIERGGNSLTLTVKPGVFPAKTAE